MTSPSILEKIKKLLNLANSSNVNEAASAKFLADNLIEKYNVSEVELNSLQPKEYYGENDKLFVSLSICNWKRQLALSVSKYFDCQIVEEQLIPANGKGETQYHYFVYGDQIKNTQLVYHAFDNKINILTLSNCINKGEIYISSYCEGIVESIKWNIEMYGINLPDIKKPINKKEEGILSTLENKSSLIKSGINREEPTPNKVDINESSNIKDIMAFFKGIEDGKSLLLQELITEKIND